MHSLIANKVKTNMRLVSIKILIVHTFYVCHWYYNIYTNNYLLDILHYLQPFSMQQHLFVRSE